MSRSQPHLAPVSLGPGWASWAHAAGTYNWGVAKRITKGNLWGYIQSRPYASVSDIRRLFAMDVDGAAPIPTSEGTCYIGLPLDAAELIRQLWHEGRIALDLNPNIKARVVQGVYPARAPVFRLPPQTGDQSGPPPTAGGESASRKRRRRRKRKPGAGNDGGGNDGGGADAGGAEGDTGDEP